ncbi:ABC transporter substrate-binding protein [Mesorhizobium sp. YR577]|uniref:ABC transporter substrate-binding protein n=1 Tax=Mesorhizobium sp. YR577 TaxID=1884373 RepID=UPI0008E2FACF|nr:ABC transporter substrate-binding protein [Mesorhizobium sp. YR577]SFU16842.1 amino acid/amide ABC transporter substrate-binding protein, HAAT family [Mesorhizobium sp. YR577]
MIRICATAAAVLLAFSRLAQAEEPVKIGLVTTLTTPAAVIGRDVQDAINLSIEQAGGKIAGRPIELIVEDDTLKPDVGRQKTEKLVRQDKVDFITGYIWSHVLLASRKSALDAGAIVISTNAAPSDMAGKLCDPNFYTMRGQGDVMSMALGEELNRRGVKTVYTMAPNYAAGQDVVKGLQSVFKGEVVGQDFTKWGDDPQLDFSAEFSKVAASGAEALFAFYPGRATAFMTQFEQSGLKDKVNLYSVYTLDQIALPALQKGNAAGALGSVLVDYWYPDLDTPENRVFVAAFRKKYGRDPSNYAAAAYDVIPLIKSAVEAVGGDLNNKAGLRAALEAANFKSVRGKLTFGRNHMPLDNYYALEVEAGPDGKWHMSKPSLALERGEDPYVANCKMPGAS